MRRRNDLREGYGPLVTRLRAALLWVIEDQPQPKGALIQHHGIYSSGRDGVMSLIPDASGRFPAVVFRFTGTSTFAAKLTGPACEELLRCVRAALPIGVRVRETWNVVGCDTMGVGISRQASASVLGLVSTYHAGCQEHWPHSVFCGCDWFKRGYAKAILPEGWR